MWPLKNWVRIAEIIVVIWAVNGMHGAVIMNSLAVQEAVQENALLFMSVQAGINLPLAIALFYFLSVALILYLLRKYERKNYENFTWTKKSSNIKI